MVIKGFMVLCLICRFPSFFNMTFPANVLKLAKRLNDEEIMVMSDDANTSSIVCQRYYKALSEYFGYKQPK